MLKINCNRCKRELDAQGALIFGAPVGMQVTKYHICQICFDDVFFWIEGKKDL